MTINRREQASFDDEQLDHPQLAGALEDWQAAKDRLVPPRQEFTRVDKTVKGLVAGLELEPGAYRVGRFLIRIAARGEAHVEFDRQAGTRLSIHPAATSD